MTASNPRWVRLDGVAHLGDLPLVLDHPQRGQEVGELVVGLRWRLLLAGLVGLARRGADLVEGARQLGVGVADDAHGTSPGVLAEGVGELVDVAGRQAELGLDVGEAWDGRRPRTRRTGRRRRTPRCRARRGGGSRGSTRACRPVARLEDEHRVGLAVAAQAGEVREGAVRAEDVVAVVAADLQATGRDDEALAAGSALTRRRGARRRTVRPRPVRACPGARGPARGDERPELVGGRAAAVLWLRLLFAHAPIVPRAYGAGQRVRGPAVSPPGAQI